MNSAIADALGQVHQGDCIAGMRDLPDASVQLVFADPPFNIGYDYDEYDDKLDSDQYIQWSAHWMSQVYRVLDDTGAFWLAIGDEYAAELKVEAQRIGFHTRSWVVWYYTFGVHCKNKFTRSHAHLFHFVKHPKKFVFNRDEVAVPSARQLVYGDKRANPAGRMPDDTWILRPQDCVDGFTPDEDLWYFPRVAGTFKERAGFHGCQMPEQLLGRIIASCSNPDDVVMDPFSGSSTTLTVAKKKGRQFIGFEMSKEYAKLGRQRIEAVCVGDPLEGSAEPKASAPATFSPKARRREGSGPNATRFTPLFDFAEIETQSETIIEAFAQSNRGYTVDRVVADPLLNEDFQIQCERLQVPGTPAERNRSLFRLRKSGQFKSAGVEFNKQTRLEWEDIDPLLFASEIAWREVSQLYADASLDEILCDPRMATQFDEIAAAKASGFSPLQYRWAALKLRKQSSLGRKRAGDLKLAKFKTEQWQALETIDVSSLPNAAGVYVICHQEEYLYAGETINLHARLELQLAAPAIDKWPVNYRDRSQLNIAFRETQITTQTRLAHQSGLIKRHRPKWNFNELFVSKP